MFIFPIIYIVSFIVALREVIRGNTEGVLIYMIFGLSVYTTAMSVAFTLGLKDFIPFLQSLKELFIIAILVLNVVNLKYRPRFNLIDYAILAFLLYTGLYTILPIGDQSFGNRLVAFKINSFFVIVYFAGRLFDPKTIYINKYFNYFVVLTIAAAAVLTVEVVMQQQLQSLSGYTDYAYYFYGFEPDGLVNGLNTTFTTEGGYLRFASFFTNPLEHASATIIAIAILLGLYTEDNNRFRITSIGVTALGASLLSILFAFSRAPLASYCVVIYFYALITRKKFITNTIHFGFAVVALYFTYLFFQFERNNHSGIIEEVMNTLDFSNVSSIGHIEQWVEGVIAIAEHPLGLGMGASGRVSGATGDNVGGENQFIIFGVQAGLVAVFLYLYVLVMYIKTCLKWLPTLKGKERKLCIAVLLMKIGFIIPLLTSEVEGSSYISYIHWFLSGLLMSMIMQHRKNIEPQPVYDH